MYYIEVLDLLKEYKHKPKIVQKIIAFQLVKKLPFGNIGVKIKSKLKNFLIKNNFFNKANFEKIIKYINK